MTLQELQNRVKVTEKKTFRDFKLKVTYKVEVTYKRKKYTCISRNCMAWDAINAIGDVTGLSFYKTQKQGYQAFYDECLRKNKIGKFAPKDYCVITIYK